MTGWGTQPATRTWWRRRSEFAIRCGTATSLVALVATSFLVVCSAVDGSEDALVIARRIRAGLSGTSLQVGPEVVTPMASIGVAFAAGNASDADTLVARADRAMYASKRSRLGNPVLDASDCGQARFAA